MSIVPAGSDNPRPLVPTLDNANPRQRLQYAVKSWVHYDNLAISHTKQAQNARELRAQHEKEIQDILISMKQPAAVLEINGAKLQFKQQETKSPPTWSWLQENIRNWFAIPENRTKGRAEDLYKFLLTKRTIRVKDSLEKI